MELLNLKTLSKTIAITKIKQSSKIVIRDVDEISKNNFVAYADDKSESYDVALEIDENDNVIDDDCDCEIKGLCTHRIAFMIYLLTRKSTTKSVRAKKQSPTEILVNNLETNALKIWINDLLKKNKDIELLFVNKFTINTLEYTKPIVKNLIQNSIKSIIKTRKNIETNELKKVVDLLEVTLKPVFEFCLNELTNLAKFEIILFTFEELMEFDNKIYSSSIKVTRFIEKLSKQVIDSFSNQNDDLKWQKITDLHFELILNDKLNILTICNFKHIKLLYNSTLNNEFRKKYFAEKTKNFALGLHTQKLKFDSGVSYFILNVMYDNDLFEQNYNVFQAYKYENEYNLSLIDKLITIKKIKEAEEMALSQNANNYYIDYNLPYWQRLKSIYINQNHNIKLANILIETVPIEMNFDDYLLVKKEMPENEFKQYRSNLLGRVKRTFHANKNAPIFYFQLLAQENNYKKMLDTISEYTDYDLVYEYKTELYNLDKNLFLKQMALIQSNDYFRTKEYNSEYRDKLINWIIDNYDNNNIQHLLKTYLNRIDSQFLELLATKVNHF
ncbi:MAG: hypothetical protein H7174_00010 [Flavobacterium sp.]|nr:hypothetical protein [Flavobacterium sp.]